MLAVLVGISVTQNDRSVSLMAGNTNHARTPKNTKSSIVHSHLARVGLVRNSTAGKAGRSW
jgi:hypothetical protein